MVARLRADPPDAERVSIAIELAAEFSDAMNPDPLLPPELLPQPWPGAEARDLVAQCWALLLAGPYRDAPRLFGFYADVISSITLPRTPGPARSAS